MDPDAPEIVHDTSDTDDIVAALRFEHDGAHDEFAADLAALEREERLLELIDIGAARGRVRAAPAAHRLACATTTPQWRPLIVEVLIRLPTPEFGVLASHEFLDTAERNGRMPAIDRWVIRALLVWMQRNRDRWADANAVFSVNLSGKSVVRPDFRNYLENCLDKSGLPLTALRFEVAELDTGLAPQEFAALARALIERGCEVSVDNAGTGTGRFDFLREVNADILKIDGSLVQGASDDIVSRALHQRPGAHGRHARHAHRGEPGGFHRQAARGHAARRRLRAGLSACASPGTSRFRVPRAAASSWRRAANRLRADRLATRAQRRVAVLRSRRMRAS